MNALRMERTMITIGMMLMEAMGLILLICGLLNVHPF